MLGDICISGGYSHTRTTATVLNTLTGSEQTEVVLGLGHLQRSMLCQSITLKAKVPDAWKEPAPPKAADPTAALEQASGLEANDIMPSASADLSTVQTATSEGDAQAAPATRSTMVVDNARSLRHLASLLTSFLQPFFSGSCPLRRSPRPTIDLLLRQVSSSC